MKMIIVALISVLFLFSLNACVAMSKDNQGSQERVKRYLNEMTEEQKKSEEPWRKEIYDVIFIGMSKEDFENKFGEYIFKKDGDVLYFIGPITKNKARVTFYNGLLVKYERYERYYGWVGPAFYSDESIRLRNYAPL